MTKKESYLVKVGDPRPAGGGLPATGPEYRYVHNSEQQKSRILAVDAVVSTPDALIY